MRGVVTNRGAIACEKLVLCAGLWTQPLAARAGVAVPLSAVHHQYLVTEKINGVTSDLPTLRDPDRLTYYKEEVGDLVMGGYEPNPVPWSSGAVPEDFASRLLEDDWDHFEPIVDLRARPRAGARRGRRQADDQRPRKLHARRQLDDRRSAGGARNFFVGAGFNAFGIASAGGAGMALAEWAADGEQPLPTSGRSTSAVSARRTETGLGARADARSLCAALQHRLALRRIYVWPAAAALAAL